ncbi:hypothetical protein CROQUDRAFT_678066, partial [Cronartium quercuum f. sp. fusiforme G11]
MYRAFGYMKPMSSGEIAPIYRMDRMLTTDKAEQATLLFKGTSITHIPADLSDPVPNPPQEDDCMLPPITQEEIENVIQRLPKKKVKGVNTVPNELLQLAIDHILEPLGTLL